MLRSPCTIESAASAASARRCAFLRARGWVVKVTLSAFTGQLRGQTCRIPRFHRSVRRHSPCYQAHRVTIMQPLCRAQAATGILIASLCVSSCARFTSSGSERDGQAKEAVREIVESSKRPDYVTRDRDGARLWKLVHNFYQHREFAPAWIDDGSPKPQMDALIRAIHTANREGLDPELYSANLLDQRKQESSRGFLTKKGFNPEEATAMDVWLTWLYMKFASDLADGVSDLAHADPAWKIEAKSFDSLAHLERALRDNRIAESLFELTPTNPDYRTLQRALEDHRAMADRG